MFLLKNLKLGAKIFAGFGAILVISLVALIFGYTGLMSNSTHFTRYREIAAEHKLASEVQDNLLKCRIAFKNYVDLGEDSQKKVFEDEFAEMEQAIEELKKNIKDQDKMAKVSHILEAALQYKEGFLKIAAYKEERESVYRGLLGTKGLEMERDIAKLIEEAYAAKNLSAVHSVGSVQQHLLSARLDVVKRLSNNEPNTEAVVKQEFAEMDKWLEISKGEIQSSQSDALFHSITENKETYYNGFLDIGNLMEKESDAKSTMDTIGPDITKAAEDIKDSIRHEQELYVPIVRENIKFTLWWMGILSLIALVAACGITLGVVKIVAEPVVTVTNTFKEISEGDANLGVRLKVNSRDELGDMAKYFNTFIEKLAVIMEHNKSQTWMKTGQAELSERLRSLFDETMICDNTLSYLAKYLNAQIGAVYIKTDEGYFKMLAGYAYHGNNDLSKGIVPGENLIGQAALEKDIIMAEDLPADYFKIKSGMGEALPKHLAVVPCMYNHQVIGIIELGAFHQFSHRQIEFMRSAAESMAISIHAAQSHFKTQTLLQKTTEQAEELQMQQEELRTTNEELEEQTKFLRDSQARLQAQQEELRVINEELEERSKSLEIQKNDAYEKNENLKIAQVEIEEKAEALALANQYKTEFLANMSHELRTPLNSILVLSQLLANRTKDTPFTAKELEFAKVINASGTELLRLINDVLDLSKIEAGKMEIHLDEMRLLDVTANAERSFKALAEEKGLLFSVCADEGIPKHIYTDAQKVNQIVTNLLANAIKFTVKGSVTLSIERLTENDILAAGEEYAEGVKIAVADTGIGIPKDKHKVIFEAFRQSDGTTSRKYGGTGLGLSISKDFARILDGKLFVESEVGRGSVFKLILPLRCLHAENTEKAEQEEGRTEGEPVGRTGDAVIAEESTGSAYGESAATVMPPAKEKLLLIIEDDRNFAGILASLAEEKGFRCITAQHGSEGIKMAEAYEPSAILLDIGLPDISGWQVAEELKANPATAGIPVHVISGAENYQKNGGDDIAGYLKKPISAEEISNVLLKIEAAIAKPLKRLLVLGDEIHTSGISKELGHKDIAINAVSRGEEALRAIRTEVFDCMIVDLKLYDMTGLEFFARLKEEHGCGIPVIVYTDEELSRDLEEELRKYTESIIIKGSRAMERLVAEASLFLHGLGGKHGNKIQKPIRAGQEKVDSLKGKKVLIVDDDMRNVFALTNVLEEKGMHVLVGRNGLEGIDKLRQDKEVDLVLMDIMMPEMDGYTAIREIRRERTLTNLPVIALTAKAMKEDRQKCIEAGANDYITKPVEIDKLISLMLVWLYK